MTHMLCPLDTLTSLPSSFLLSGHWNCLVVPQTHQAQSSLRGHEYVVLSGLESLPKDIHVPCFLTSFRILKMEVPLRVRGETFHDQNRYLNPQMLKFLR